MRNRRTIAALICITALGALGLARNQQQTDQPKSVAPVKMREGRAVLAQAKRAALKIKNDFQRGLVLDEIGAAEAKAGEIDAAVETATRAYPHTMATLRAIGEQLGNANDLTKADLISPQLKGGGASTVFAFIASRQAERGNIDEALRTVRQIRSPEVRSDALGWIAEQQAARGDYAGVRKTQALARSANPGERPSFDDAEMLIAANQLSRGDTGAARATIAAIKSTDNRYAAMIVGTDELRKRADKTVAVAWLEDALKELPADPRFDFDRYIAIPYQVKLGQTERAMQAAGRLPPELQVKGYNAVAVTCAEMKDVAGVDAALQAMHSAARSANEDQDSSDIMEMLMILNTTAALIDNGQSETASRLLTTLERSNDAALSRMNIETQVHLQRIFIVAQADQFDDARSLALKMPPDSVGISERGTALRVTTLLQTRKDGAGPVQVWVSELADSEDQAHALLGIAQALLGIDDVKLFYSAIQIH